MKNKILWIISILPVVFTVVALRFIPDQVPLHYFNKKAASAETDKIKKEAENNAKVLYYTAVGMAVMFGALNLFIIYLAYTGAKQGAAVSAIDISSVTGVMLFIIIIASVVSILYSYKVYKKEKSLEK